MNDANTERVKWCLHCEAILPFDQETCSVCGASTSVTGDEEPVKPCVTCSELIPEADFFCPKCGDFALAVPAADTSAPALAAMEAGAMTILQRLLSVTLFAAGAVLAISGIVEFFEWRALLG